MLRENGFHWSEEGFLRSESFASVRVWRDSDVLLKLDFVNDSAPLFGEVNKTDLFYRTDSIHNILSNKLSAIFRFAGKDIADIREIALREEIDWHTVIQEARQKEAGIELIYISEILAGMPQSEFEMIAWVKKPDWDEFRNDIGRIVFDMLAR